jgi:hypothetical protein
MDCYNYSQNTNKLQHLIELKYFTKMKPIFISDLNIKSLKKIRRTLQEKHLSELNWWKHIWRQSFFQVCPKSCLKSFCYQKMAKPDSILRDLSSTVTSTWLSLQKKVPIKEPSADIFSSIWQLHLKQVPFSSCIN